MWSESQTQRVFSHISHLFSFSSRFMVSPSAVFFLLLLCLPSSSSSSLSPLHPPLFFYSSYNLLFLSVCPHSQTFHFTSAQLRFFLAQISRLYQNKKRSNLFLCLAFFSSSNQYINVIFIYIGEKSMFCLVGFFPLFVHVEPSVPFSR